MTTIKKIPEIATGYFCQLSCHVVATMVYIFLKIKIVS